MNEIEINVTSNDPVRKNTNAGEESSASDSIALLKVRIPICLMTPKKWIS